ncbi:MAG TPA: acyltransferase family protein [Candidatus Limnocylindrales bacterium]|nr:acyltransferase family protein [Candidatus Limnocylindrales bacterium]
MTFASAPHRLGRLRGLDGLRAIAVAAVVVYHLGLGAAPGGFFGVEVFFVISGFLITGLLLAEWRATGSISLPRFWARRARRLLPALFALLLGTRAVAAIAYPGELARLRTDALAAFGYVTNWYLVVAQQPYFETVGRPSPLLHLWSLAIEEQFYLVWPVVLGVVLLFAGRRGALLLAVTGIVASAAATVALYVPDTDPSRVYYGTDTRAAGLLAGALLALVVLPGRSGVTSRPSVRRRLLADFAAIAGLAAIVAAFAFLDETDARLFPAGMLAIDAATLVLIAAVAGPTGGLVAAVLETQPFRWLGTRSYAVYLWHWPIFVFTRPGLDLPVDGPAGIALRLLATAALAEASYRLVERPIRGGALGRAWARWRAADRSRLARIPDPRPGLVVAGAGVVAVLLADVAGAPPPAAPAELPVTAMDGLVTPPPGPGDGTGSDAVSVPVSAVGGAATAPPAGTSRPSPSATDSASGIRLRRVPVAGPVVGVGESVLIAAAPSLARVVGPLAVDAAVGRQVPDDVAAIRKRAAQGRLGQTVILNIGNNGPIYPRDADQAMDELRDVQTIVWVNVSVPRQWQDHNNRLIAQYAARHGNVRLVDWHAASAGRPELFAPDDVHPNRDGARLMASLVADALAP